jgi:dienelactone hydrolase
LQTFGPLGPQLAVTESASAVHRNATALYQTEAAAFEITVRFDTHGLIDDLYVSPTISNPNYQTPAYDDPTRYTEKEVTIGDGPLALPGTLTMPVGNGPFPVVVLVHGSGPNNRDESIGAVKTFRDLAVGLAAQGVAVLRYEKVTREHPLKLQLSGKPLTVKEETVDDAIRAVELLRHTSGIDPSRIYVAGHSQGGMLIPRIVEAGQDLGIAGAVVMAGPSRPLEDLIVEQLNFQMGLAKKAGVPTEAMEQQVAQYEKQVQLLKDPQYSVGNPPSGFLLGDPTWWLDIRNWHAGEEAKDQKVPLLILQGENDIQVFPDNMGGWKSSLAARTDVEYKLYPKVNHTLVESAEPSTGREYEVPANVPDYIISDIAKWIAR